MLDTRNVRRFFSTRIASWALGSLGAVVAVVVILTNAGLRSELELAWDRLLDTELRCQVYEGLFRSHEPGAKGLEVTVEDRIVTLAGEVDEALASRQAEAIAGSILGVQSVVNESTVVDLCPHAAAVPLPDDEVAIVVREELAASGAIDLDTVAIGVSSGVVELTGSVRSEAEKQLADLLAGSAQGVAAVVNALRVR
jgi:hyperosmotically inducible protein